MEDKIILGFTGLMACGKGTAAKYLASKPIIQTSEIIKKWYLTNMLQDLIDNNNIINPVEIDGNWCEIDTVQDLERARKLFS